MTLLDFPGRVACTVFTLGCNFRCPFCHNTPLVLPGSVTEADPSTASRSPSPASRGGFGAEEYPQEEFFRFLAKRQGLLDGVAITGGEPLLHRDAADFIRQIRALGYAVKLDTNGAFPERLRKILEAGLVDYVAMDIKNSREKYAMTVGLDDAGDEGGRFVNRPYGCGRNDGTGNPFAMVGNGTGETDCHTSAAALARNDRNGALPEERIATPVCALARNDRNGALPEERIATPVCGLARNDTGDESVGSRQEETRGRIATPVCALARNDRSGILSAVEQSVRVLMESGIDYEFRTTLVDELHEPEDFTAIGQWIAGAKRYFIQGFVDSGDILGGEAVYHAASKETAEACLAAVKPYVPGAELRGIS